MVVEACQTCRHVDPEHCDGPVKQSLHALLRTKTEQDAMDIFEDIVQELDVKMAWEGHVHRPEVFLHMSLKRYLPWSKRKQERYEREIRKHCSK